MVVLCLGATDIEAKAKKKKAAAVTHNVTFIYGLKSITVPVEHGKNAPVPTDVDVPGYTFTTWVGNSNCVTEDRVILGAYVSNIPVASTQTNSAYTQRVGTDKSAPFPTWWNTLNIKKGTPGKTCAVHWYNGWTGELWKTDIVPYGSSLATPPDPCISGYEFAGWVGDWTNVTEDRAIMATYYVNHTITFCDERDDDPYIDKKRVRDGEGAWIDPPSHDNYDFIGYYRTDDGSKYEGGGVHHDITVVARYKKHNE